MYRTIIKFTMGETNMYTYNAMQRVVLDREQRKEGVNPHQWAKLMYAPHVPQNSGIVWSKCIDHG